MEAQKNVTTAGLLTHILCPALGGSHDESRVPVDKTLYFQKTTDGGKTWRAITNGLPEGNCWDIIYRHALGLKGKDLAFATTTGNFYWSADQGESWNTVSTTLPPVYSLELVQMISVQEAIQLIQEQDVH